MTELPNSRFRIQIDCTKEEAEFFNILKDEEGLTGSELLKKALRVYSYISHAQQKQEKILVERADGSIREIVLLS